MGLASKWAMLVLPLTLAGCDPAAEQDRIDNDTKARLGLSDMEVDGIPDALYDLQTPAGVYEIVVETPGRGLQSCFANVNEAAHGHKSVILTECEPEPQGPDATVPKP